MNITIDFMLQLPQSEKAMLENYELRIYEDLCAFKSRVKIIHQTQLTDQTMNLVVCVPNFESSSFKTRRFEITFVEKNDSVETLEYP